MGGSSSVRPKFGEYLNLEGVAFGAGVFDLLEKINLITSKKNNSIISRNIFKKA